MKRVDALGAGLAVLAGVLLAACAGNQGGGFNIQNVDVSQLVQNVKGLRELSEPEEIEIGDGVTETLLGARPMEDDVELQRYVNVVGLWVARQSERPNLPWHFAVSDSDHINAFATPGGNVIILSDASVVSAACAFVIAVSSTFHGAGGRLYVGNGTSRSIMRVGGSCAMAVLSARARAL